MEHVPFGAFNPRFYGLSFFLASDDRLDAWERYQRAADSSDSSLDVAGSSLNAIASLSAMDHELRHFHDFLLSPLGTVTMGLRMQASINGVQALRVLRECRGRFVPVPMLRWIEWDASARGRWLASTGRSFGIHPSDLVDLPHVGDRAVAGLKQGTQAVSDSLLPEQQLSLYVLSAALAYSSMDARRRHRVSQFDIEVSAEDVFEAVAHLVQSQAVWTVQGEAATHSFLEFVLTSEAKHLGPLQVLWTVLQRSSQPVTIQRATELCTWMLLGSDETPTSGGHPAERYFEILTMAAGHPDADVFTGEMVAARLFDRLDALTGSVAWRASLDSASTSADRRRDRYESLARTLSGGYFDALFSVAATWHSDQHSARRTFQDDPDSLTDPLRYVTEKRFPLPFVETRLGWRVHERDEPLGSRHRAIYLDTEQKKALSYISKLDTTRPDTGLDDVLSVRTVTHMIDFLFSDEPVLDLYEHWCRSQIQAFVGKELVSVY
jgi:hypothetical protein